MERVQYQLERSIPQLQLLDEHAVFTKEQLRSITTQRQTFEARLLRRGPEKIDFLRYAQFERNLADLINVKANRIGLPRSFHRDNAAAHTGHIVAIYERMVLKFKYDVDAWQQYIAFAKSRKMRVVTGRVYARALALHPNNVPLWLAAAAHELNDNASTTAARSLLQRALRLNRLPWKRSEVDSASSANGKRTAADSAPDSSKRVRTDSSSAQNGNGASDSGPAALKVSDREADLLRLWVEYIRMELVFIERLRRRWLVLGLEWESQGGHDDAAASSSNDTAEAQQAALDLDTDIATANTANSDELDADQERILLSQVPENDADAAATAEDANAATGAKPNTFTPRKMTTIPPAQIGILRGSIPLYLIGSALESLAPHLHFVLLVALLDVLQTFPFAEPLSLDAPKSGEALRRRLLDQVYTHLSDRQRWGWHHFAPAALVAALRSFRPDTTAGADQDERTAAHVANTEEMESHRLLTSASHLRTTFSNEIDGLLELASQLRSGSAAARRAPVSASGSSSTLAVQLVLQLLQSLLTVTAGSGSRPSASYDALAASGLLPVAVSDAVKQMRSWCAEAPVDVSVRKGPSAKADFYTTTSLLLEMLADSQRSAIDEPNLVQYLDSVQTQLIVEARGAGAGVETAQMRAVSVRRQLDTALAIESDKERSKKLGKLQAQIKQATTGEFGASDELWSLRILVATQLAKTSGAEVEHSRDAIGAEWRRGLQACAGADGSTGAAESSLWARYLEWLYRGVAEAPHKKKAAFKYSSEQFRWAVRETASLLSRSSSGSVEALQHYRQELHDLCVSRYLGLSREVGKVEETLAWLLQSSFASHHAWISIASQLGEDGEDKLVRRVFGKLLQTQPDQVEIWTAYLRYLAVDDMTEALKTLESCKTTVGKAEYKLVEREWHSICQDLEKTTQNDINDAAGTAESDEE